MLPAPEPPDHLPLAAEYGLGGVHLNGRNPMPPAGFRGVVSRSCHTLGELAESAPDDRLPLPEPDFRQHLEERLPGGLFGRDAARCRGTGVIDVRTLALGGVTPARLPQVRA